MPPIKGSRWFSALGGSNYTLEQINFLRDMDCFKRRLGRMPTNAEILTEVIRLGYRKTENVTLRTAMQRLRGK